MRSCQPSEGLQQRLVLLLLLLLLPPLLRLGEGSVLFLGNPLPAQEMDSPPTKIMKREPSSQGCRWAPCRSSAVGVPQQCRCYVVATTAGSVCFPGWFVTGLSCLVSIGLAFAKMLDYPDDAAFWNAGN